MFPTSCRTVRVSVCDRDSNGSRTNPPPPPSSLWDSLREADGHVVSLETYGETQVCNLPRTTGGPSSMHSCTYAHTLTECNLPGAYGWPSIPLHLSYTKTAQTQFILPGGVGESENFFRPADRVRNHPLTRMLQINVLDGWESKTVFRVLAQNPTHVGVAAHPVSHPLQFINLAPFQSRRYPPFRESERERWRSWEHQQRGRKTD